MGKKIKTVIFRQNGKKNKRITIYCNSNFYARNFNSLCDSDIRDTIFSVLTTYTSLKTSASSQKLQNRAGEIAEW